MSTPPVRENQSISINTVQNVAHTEEELQPPSGNLNGRVVTQEKSTIKTLGDHFVDAEVNDPTHSIELCDAFFPRPYKEVDNSKFKSVTNNKFSVVSSNTCSIVGNNNKEVKKEVKEEKVPLKTLGDYIEEAKKDEATRSADSCYAFFPRGIKEVKTPQKTLGDYIEEAKNNDTTCLADSCYAFFPRGISASKK